MFFAAVDEWILTRVFEPVAWWVQARTGVNGLRIAALIMVGLVLYAPLLTLALMDPSPLRDKVLLETTFFCAAMAWLAVPDMLREAKRLNRRHGMNPYRSEVFFRMMSLVMLVAVALYLIAVATNVRHLLFDQYVVVFLYLNPVYVCALYMRSVHTLPPGYAEHEVAPRRA